MKIYISSTQNDLLEYRLLIAKALEGRGHQVLQMEKYQAQPTVPIARCVKDVASVDIYVGLFAWQYGYVPEIDPGLTDLPSKVIPGQTSFTEAEYHAAENNTRLIFLLAESYPWPPEKMDAYANEDNGTRIKRLRSHMKDNHIIEFFTTPEQLVNKVTTAVRSQELRASLELKSLRGIDPYTFMMKENFEDDAQMYTSEMTSISDRIKKYDEESHMIINLGSGNRWWSTRLYFMTSLLVDFTIVRLIVFVDGNGRFFGATNALVVRDVLARRLNVLRNYEEQIRMEEPNENLEVEINRRKQTWTDVMNNAGGEIHIKTWIRKQELRTYLGDALVQRAVDWPSDKESGQQYVLEVVRQILKWPHDVVPILRDGRFYKAVEREVLSHEIAVIFVNERLQELKKR